MKHYALILFALCLFIPSTCHADLPGPPPGAALGPTNFLPGQDVDDYSGSPKIPGQLKSVSDFVKPGEANVAFFDFGTITNASSDPIKHEFVLQNCGNSALSIDHVQPGCGCTTATILNPEGTWPIQLTPSSELTVHVSVDTKQLYVGKINKIVWIFLSGQTTPAFTLHIVGMVIPMASFEPDSIDFGKVESKNQPTWQIKVITQNSVFGNTPPTPISSTGKVTLRQIGAATNSRDQITRSYVVSISKKCGMGLVSDLISIPYHNLNSGPSLLISGEINGSLSVSSNPIRFGEIVKHRKSYKSVKIITYPKSSESITVRTSCPQLSAKVLHGAHSSTIKVCVTAQNLGDFESSITLLNGDGQQLVVPVFAWVVNDK